MLAAVAAGGTRTHADGETASRERRAIRIAPRVGEPERIVICAEPAPVCLPVSQSAAGCRADAEPPLVRELRWGLLRLCEGYRHGVVSAAEYGSALQAYPALVVQLVALSTFADGRSDPLSGGIRDWLAASPALAVTCRLGPQTTVLPCELVAPSPRFQKPLDQGVD